ncbi:MAG: hypothetical protein U0528_04905 [Anaerolineae bacterium]
MAAVSQVCSAKRLDQRLRPRSIDQFGTPGGIPPAPSLVDAIDCVTDSDEEYTGGSTSGVVGVSASTAGSGT